MRAQSARAIISLTLLHVTLLAGGLGPRNPLAQDGQSDAAAAARRLVVGGECWDLLYYICHYVLVGHLVVYIELILYGKSGFTGGFSVVFVDARTGEQTQKSVTSVSSETPSRGLGQLRQ